jgi:hypothetical protein
MIRTSTSIVLEKVYLTLNAILNQVRNERDHPSGVIVVGVLSCPKTSINSGNLENQ